MKRKKVVPAYQAFEDRRNYPRLKMNASSQAIGPDGQSIAIVLYDLSPESAQIQFSIRDGKKLFPNTVTAEEIKALQFSVLFELNYKDVTSTLNLNARPVYLRTIDDKTMASGIMFVNNKWEEMKKVSDFLFYQLESSFYDPDLVKKFISKNKTETAGGTIDKGEDKAAKTPASTVTGDKSPSLKDKAESDLEFVKTEIIRLAASMKSIQEITRHIDEKMQILEQKISRKS